MYQRYMTQAEYDAIAAGKYNEYGRVPHCSATTFHLPQTCPFCDGYYRAHPDFVPAAYAPAAYAPAEANGWGGNMAPIVDDAKAAEEDAAWKRALAPYDQMRAEAQAVLKPTRWQRVRRRLLRQWYV